MMSLFYQPVNNATHIIIYAVNLQLHVLTSRTGILGTLPRVHKAFQVQDQVSK